MSSSSCRQARSRRTNAVLSDSEAFQPWWRDDALSPMRCSRPKSLRFRSGDPFDRFAALRYLIIAISIITPAVILLTSDFTPGALHHDWKADPMAEVRRSLLEGQSRSALASLKATIDASPGDAKLLRALAALAADSAPAEARRAYHKLNSLGLARMSIAPVTRPCWLVCMISLVRRPSSRTFRKRRKASRRRSLPGSPSCVKLVISPPPTRSKNSSKPLQMRLCSPSICFAVPLMQLPRPATASRQASCAALPIS